MTNAQFAMTTYAFSCNIDGKDIVGVSSVKIGEMKLDWDVAVARTPRGGELTQTVPKFSKPNYSLTLTRPATGDPTFYNWAKSVAGRTDVLPSTAVVIALDYYGSPIWEEEFKGVQPKQVPGADFKIEGGIQEEKMEILYTSSTRTYKKTGGW